MRSILPVANVTFWRADKHQWAERGVIIGNTFMVG